jgi:hypothetical protein
MSITTIGIVQIEQAINHWRNASPAVPENQAVCREVRKLADVYAHMIYHQKTEIAVSALSDEQIAALSPIVPDVMDNSDVTEVPRP